MSVVEKFVSMEYGPAPEDAKEALAWLAGHERRFGHFIHGAWREPQGGERFDSTDPSTGEVLASIAQGSAQDVDAAVQTAPAPPRPPQALTPPARARHPFPPARPGAKPFTPPCPPEDTGKRQA